MGEINRGKNQRQFALRIRIRVPSFAVFAKSALGSPKRLFVRLAKAKLRWRMLAAAVVIILANVYNALVPFFTERSYALGGSETLLPETSPQMASAIKFDASSNSYDFTPDQGVQTDALGQATRASATANKDASKGIKVTDPTNKVDFTMTPKFNVQEGRQDKDRIIYPLTNGTGWVVYTMQGIGVKEDILLTQTIDDKASYSFQLTLGNNLDAKMQSDGSIGIYGNTLLSGNVSTGSQKDAELLEKAREKASKTTLLFTIPAPVVNDAHGPANGISAKYVLKGDELTVEATGLKKGKYPITIDPSIYVVSASQFMAGNNETNVNFDVNNKLIKKGKTTGARFDSWNTTSGLPAPTWNSGTVAAGGYVYNIGGGSSSGQIYNTAGNSTFVVPSGVTSVTAKMWGAGGGSGGSYAGWPGGAGGGGGFSSSTISVTPGETLSITTGGGGGAGLTCSGFFCGGGGSGGGGGGYSGIFRGATPLLIAGGGGGGGATMNSTGAGGTAGAAGGSNGMNGSPSPVGTTNFGFGGTQSAGGNGGLGNCAGANGTYLGGGGGGQYSGGCNTGSGPSGGIGGGGNGGIGFTGAGAGGGGGGGYFGGGGGAHGSVVNGGGPGGGAGGGSSFTSGTNSLTTAGSGTDPGNSSDTDRGTAGQGGAAVNASSDGNPGTNGIVMITFGTGTITPASQVVSWSKFNTGTGTIDNADPGTGTCSSWCTTSSYNLPSGRANMSVVAYNGFIYVMGGTDVNGTRQNSVYVAKIGATGEPQLWHPTDTNKSNWVYWYQDTNLSSIRAYSSAVAYNNRMYLVGGIAASAPVSTVEVADITPTGKLGTWTATTSLPAASYGHTAQVYNDRLYLIGGAATVGGAPTNAVYYTKINSNGTLNSWLQTTSFTTGRTGIGGNFSVIWGGYIYISGGCTAVNASGYCTTVASDTQAASINSDGSLSPWISMTGVSESRIGHNLIAWRDNIYTIGGCLAQNTTTGDCANGSMLSSIKYGKINQDGDVSAVSSSVASGTAPCVAANNNTNCNSPITGLHSMVAVVNNFLYVIGGCTTTNCSSTSNGIYFTTLTSTGDLTQYTPNNNNCPTNSTSTGGWCQANTNLPANRAAAAVTVTYGNLYLVGGITDSAALANTILSAPIGSNGVPGTWANNSLTGAGATSVAYANAFTQANPSSVNSNPFNMYIIGGCTTVTTTACTATTNSVYKCNINTSFVVVGCTKTGQSQLATGRGQAGGSIYGNRLYIVGGVTSATTAQATIYRATIDNSNNIGTWTSDTKTLPTAVRANAVYTYNGYLYSVGGVSGSTLQSTITFARINTTDGSIDSTGWKTSAIAIGARMGIMGIAASGYSYVVGGCKSFATGICSSLDNTVQRYAIYNNANGSPAGWSTSSASMANNRYAHGSAVLNGYIYIAGGCIDTNGNCGAVTQSVEMTKIQADGSLLGNGSGTWCTSTSGGSCPTVTNLTSTAAGGGRLVSVSGTLYFTGGRNGSGGSISSEVYYATPDPTTGAVTSWNLVSNGLPAARAMHSAVVWNNRIYVAGGIGQGTNCNAFSSCASVFISPTLSSGGDITSAWTTSSKPMPITKSNFGLVAYGNTLYALGGNDGAAGLNYADVEYAQLDVSGSAASTSGDSVGSWSYTTSLPHGLYNVSAYALNGYLYVTGGNKNGTGASSCNPTTLIAPIVGATSTNAPAGIGTWIEAGVWTLSGQGLTAGNQGAGTSVYDGKVYLTGGICNGAFATTGSGAGNQNTQQTALVSQPQVAKYSIAFDTDSDVYPTNWLLNGLDNSIGARWQLRYRSMTNPGAATQCASSGTMSTWGQETNFGNVSLGIPGIYTPKDANGLNTSCGRYFYLNTTVDSSQAFGFPDDVSRGPTITDMTLRYTADPAKRLLHGRTFTGGLQMPNDSPYYAR